MHKKISTALLVFSFIAMQQMSFATVFSSNTRFVDYDKDDYNYEQNSYNVSNVQVNEARTLEDDRRDSWTTKVINAGHFHSKTATKTWIPLNRSVDK